ncbi:MAG: GAF domain-containing protein, partial [Roseiflexaceae bacterium]|nr:GAF domain-containing protein [Roseiflexaceae bacterium]
MQTYHRAIEVVQRANQLAANAGLGELLQHALDLFVEVAGATAGTLYLFDSEHDELIFSVVRGDPNSQRLIGQRIAATRGVAGAAVRTGAPVFVADVRADPRWDSSFGELAGSVLQSAYCLPLSYTGRLIGVVQVFNLTAGSVDEAEELALLQL